jgi:hypothetical protein
VKPILLTGTSVTGVTDDPLQPSTAVLIGRALRSRGLTVDHRAVTPGEDLTGYAGAIVTMTSLVSLASFTRRYGGLWALASGLPVLVVPDDWQLNELFNSFKPRYPFEYPTEKMRSGSVQAAMTVGVAMRPQLEPVVEKLRDGEFPRLFNLYAWGNHQLATRLVPAKQVHVIDLSGWTAPTGPRVAPPEQRTRAWVLAALMDPRAGNARQRAWYQSLTTGPWPIVGQHREKGSRLQRISEAEVTDLYRQNRGVLSHPYKHAGSGWWRRRFHQAIEARAILAAHRDEVAPLGTPYLLTPGEIAGASDERLDQIADWQADTLAGASTPAVASADRLVDLLRDLNFSV